MSFSLDLSNPAVATAAKLGVIALITIILWFALGRALSRLQENAEDESWFPVLRISLRSLLVVVAIFSALDTLSINTNGLLAVLGTAGLAVALALKDTLQNIASGLMILALRPFKVGDTIDFGGTIATVKEINLFATELKSLDGLFISAPNTALWGQTITNTSRNKTRRMEIVTGVRYRDDYRKGLEVLRQLVAQEPRVLQDPEPTFVVMALADSAVQLRLRAWTKTDDFWDTYFDLMDKIKPALEAAGLEIPFPQQELHLVTSTDKTPA
ncbi:mechanosensitive ion channel family protein [Biformimicrobium ophioploci]|uniref:Small-conductance mechanosensitive channel n=1 Tax=Biformimicrobium ophioploci TaxID=3036711 RepID=A0ABQ6LVS4_9GAMM|nr:mechanosensitive ion channel family protein [Microbulbifer sp. NKW57]GMG86161.1 small-conductance mechanosensitive channel MscS [Microbulbifer sp. NKW57]